MKKNVIDEYGIIVYTQKYLECNLGFPKTVGVFYKSWCYTMTIFINRLENLMGLLNKPDYYVVDFEDYIFQRVKLTIFEIEKFHRDRYKRTKTYKVGIHIELKYKKFDAYFIFEVYSIEDFYKMKEDEKDNL